jgi:ADP-heptose:LPS heptosyltransferase
VKHILVIRFSALGDVAISIPVIKAFLEQNPGVKLVVLTKKNCARLYSLLPDVEVIAPDFKTEYQGFPGLFRLYKKICNEYQIDSVIDIHNVLRTNVLSLFFQLSGVPVFRINKGQWAKNRLIRCKKKFFKPLKTSSQRYAEVFVKAGFNLNLEKLPKAFQFPLNEDVNSILSQARYTKIGIAPFAFYPEKAYPKDKMNQVISMLSQTNNFDVFLFGGGKAEKQIADELEQKYANVHSVIGKLSMNQELALINQMSVMLTMDSSNLHLAALTQTPILSVWGATHPYAGFTAFNHTNDSDQIQVPVNELPCRPCSVFGNKKCMRNDWACMNRISPETIVNKIVEKTKQNS